MSGAPEVEILLATYNGARFLREQIDSLLAQEYTPIRVLARDDGSTDDTVAILRTYAERVPERFCLLPASAPTGSAQENFRLLMQASRADYVCFSDQDDVWLPDKVSQSKAAMDQLEMQWGSVMPLLVFSDLRLVDDELKTLADSFWKYMKIDPGQIDRMARLMVRSVVTGCTAMVNRPLLSLAVRMPAAAFMHDRWMGLLASSLGHAGIVRKPMVLYRQHAQNVVGTGRPLPGTEVAQHLRPWRQRLLKPRVAAGHIDRWNNSQRDAAAFLEEYEPALSAGRRGLLKAFLTCQRSPRRLVRVATFLRYGFFYTGVKANLAILLHLWMPAHSNDRR